jgi:hypothetical protein
MLNASGRLSYFSALNLGKKTIVKILSSSQSDVSQDLLPYVTQGFKIANFEADLVARNRFQLLSSPRPEISLLPKGG